MNDVRSPEKVRLSPRDKLKAFGLVVAAGGVAALDVALHIRNTIGLAAGIDALLNLDSGISLRDRQHKLEQAVKESIRDPEILISWLKFSALEVYANINSLVMAEKTLRQFMYGQGETVDIKDLLVASIRYEPGWLDKPAGMDINAVWGQTILDFFAQTAINKSLFINPGFTNRKFNLEVFPKPKRLRQVLDNNQFTPIRISGAGDGVNRDGLYSMNMFTQEYTGNISKVFGSPATGFMGWKVLVVDGKYCLQDRYDWQGKNLFQGVILYPNDLIVFAEKLGVPDADKWIKKRFSNNKELVRVDDNDGLRLQESGLARPFNIQAAWSVEKMNLVIPEKLLTV